MTTSTLFLPARAIVTDVGQECDGCESAVRVSGSQGGVPSADVRFGAHSGLKSDIARGPKSASTGSQLIADHFVGANHLGFIAKSPAPLSSSFSHKYGTGRDMIGLCFWIDGPEQT
jgi:hypothetical protein